MHILAPRYEPVSKKIVNWLKPGGTLILEAFNVSQLGNPSGGPKDASMLYTEDILRKDFAQLQITKLTSLTTNLDEGSFHQGKAHIIRLVAIKGS